MNLIKNIFGENCFQNSTNIFQISNDDGEVIKLKYPDINQVFKPELLEFMNSSYLIN